LIEEHVEFMQRRPRSAQPLRAARDTAQRTGSFFRYHTRQSVHIILLGPPGSGKGTQAQRIAEHYGIPHISTGHILREAVRSGSELGRKVGETIAAGSLVSDALITDIVRARLREPDVTPGALLDGFPRTVAQAEALDTIVPPERVIVVLLQVLDEEIVRRMMRRRICQSCGITQTVPDTEAAEAGHCPRCGDPLVRREDDAPEIVRHRLHTYAALAEPLIAYYTNRPGFAAIDGLQPPEAVTAALFGHVDRIQQQPGQNDPVRTR
jgi:adenylate kinase